MAVYQLVSFLFILFIACNANNQDVRGPNILITSHTGNNDWWLAYAVSDPQTTSLELKDAGAYPNWTPLAPTNWGYFTFTTAGSSVKFPISLRLGAGSEYIIIDNAFTSAAPGSVLDTRKSFTGTPSQPTTAPTQRPTQPATQAPTQRPTSAPTTAPTQRPTQPATQAPTQRPTQPATQAPTQRPTNAPTQPATQPPTQRPTTPPTATPTPAATTQPTQAPGGNPFAGTQYYINPHYTEEVDSSIATNPSKRAKMEKVKEFASAYWIDRMSVINNVTTILTQARRQSQVSGRQVMAALVIYDLPARDCAAAASNGEIPCADAECAAGINTYKTQYIDPIITVLRDFSDLTIVTIIEPDSLPNLATNMGVPKCQIAQKAYKTCVAYAIQRLATLSNVRIYVDAAHGGWLGWDEGRNKAVAVFKEVLQNAGGANLIRGFATNVANYQALGSMTDTADPCNLAGQYNFAINEVKYVSLLDASFVASGITGLKYIIDTGRNGVTNARQSCSNWCNINGAGIGIPPTSNTASSGLTNIDAYFWVKPPGESDGTSDQSAARYDIHCGSSDSKKPAPEAGQWFSDYFVMLVDNANPSL